MRQGVVTISCAGSSRSDVEVDLNQRIRLFSSKHFKITHVRVYHDTDYMLEYRGEATLVRRDYL